MADTSIKISLQLADDAAQKALSDFISKGDKADKSFNKLGNTGSNAFNEIGISIGKAIGIYDIFAGSLAANIAEKAIESLTEVAHHLFDTFVVEGVKAASEAQAAVNHLNVALAQAGQYSKDTSADFVKFAEELSKTTTYSNNAIIANAGLIESMAQLDEKGLKRATLASVNLASAFGKDLPEAATVLAKAAEGNVTALQRMGIEVQKGRTDAETFANALRAVEERVGSSAAGAVNTYAGAVSQAGNSFEKLQEAIGNLIVDNPVVIATVKQANELFQIMSHVVEDNSQVLREFVGNGIIFFIDTMRIASTVVDYAVRSFQAAIGVIQAMTSVILPLDFAITALHSGFDAAVKGMIQYTQSMSDNLNALGKTGSGSLSKITEGLASLEDAAKKGFDSLKDGSTTAIEPINNLAAAHANLTEAQKRAFAALKEFATNLANQSDDAKTSADQQIEIAKAKAESDLAVQQDLLNKKQINEITFQQNKAVIQATFDASEQQILDQKYADDVARETAALNAGLVNKTDYYKGISVLDAKYLADKSKLDAKDKKDQAKSDQELLDAKKKNAQDQVDTLNNLAQLQYSKHKQMAEVGKAASLVQIEIATQEGAIKAYNSLLGVPFIGPALGATAAALIIAYGAERAATVAGINFADGGIVPGSSFYGDNIAANVNSGEMILNRTQQTNLFRIANQGGGGIDYDQMTASFIRALSTLNQPVVVNIGGKTIVDTLRSELASGRTFA